MGCTKIGTSSKGKLVDLNVFIKEKNFQNTVVFVIGAISKGEIKADYTEDIISYSNYPLSAALACAKLCTAFEQYWDIL